MSRQSRQHKFMIWANQKIYNPTLTFRAQSSKPLVYHSKAADQYVRRLAHNYARHENYRPSEEKANSSLNSHRSRVFQRREGFLKLDQLQQNGRHSEPSKMAPTQGPNFSGQGATRASAPEPAGVHATTRPLQYQESRFTPAQPTPSAAKPAHSEKLPSKMLGSQIAGMSSKQHGKNPVSGKFAAGWAEVRAGHTIPNLRESQEEERIRSRDNSPENSSRSPRPHKPILPAQNKKTPKQLVRRRSHDSNQENSSDERQETKKNMTKTNPARSKQSSGYGSVASVASDSLFKSSSSNPPKHSIFLKSDSGDPESIVSDKEKELAGPYLSKVKVESGKEAKPIPVSNYKEREHILSEREADMYKSIKTAYKDMAAEDRERRKNKFFKKLENVHLETAVQTNVEIMNKARRKEITRQRQMKQLTRIRNKFEEEKVQRYRSQYITKKFLAYERQDRSEYGLPDKFNPKTVFNAKLKRSNKSRVTADGFIKQEKRLRKNFVKMFDDPDSDDELSKMPRMDGVDLVTIDTTSSFPGRSGSISKRIDVKKELQEAAKLVRAETSKNDDADSLLDDEEDFAPPLPIPKPRSTVPVNDKTPGEKKYASEKDRKGPTGTTVQTMKIDTTDKTQEKTTTNTLEKTMKTAHNKFTRENEENNENNEKETGYKKISSKPRDAHDEKTDKQTRGKTLGKGAFKLTSKYKGKSIKKVQEDTKVVTVAASAKEVVRTVTRKLPDQIEVVKVSKAKTNTVDSPQSTKTQSTVKDTSTKAVSSTRNSRRSSVERADFSSNNRNTQPSIKKTIHPVAASRTAQPSSHNTTQPVASSREPASSVSGTKSKPADSFSLSSRISVITEESDADVDFYDKLMAKYGIELSDSEDDS